MTLEAKNITFTYTNNSKKILSDFSFKIVAGEKIGLVAPSGHGKTTLAKILAGYEKPQSGEVLLEGKALPKQGYCPVQLIWQHAELAVNPKLKMKKVLSDAGEISPEIIHGLGLKNQWLNRYCAELSGGELQRFCIARALGDKTKYLIADEITSMLDLITQKQLWHFILQEVKNRNMGLIVISHSMNLLNAVTDRQIYL